jgi:Uncharacterized conserved protein (DUF2290)
MKKGIGKYNSQLNYLNILLKKLELIEEYNQYPDKNSLSLAEIRKLNYNELWKSYFSNNNFHFHLKDSSLLLFNFENTSFTYISNPRDSIGFGDFLVGFGLEFESYKYEYYHDYEQYLSECNLKEFPLLIRYDFDENSYNHGMHPVSHLHMGHGNNTRIGFISKMDVEAFVYFIIRQIYPSYWKLILNDNELLKRINSNKNELMIIEDKFYNSNDKLELYLKY